jgi:hypothetical protein
MAHSILDHASSALIVRLARGEPGLGLARQLCDPNVLFRSADKMEAYAKAFVEEAKALGVAPQDWRICADFRSVEGHETTLKTPLFAMAGIPNAPKALAVIAKAGASPWTPTLSPSRDDPLALRTTSEHNAHWMVAWATSDALPLGVRKNVFRALVEHMQLEDAPVFFDRLDERAAQAGKNANPQARAVMGDGDKAAKALAQVLLDSSDALRARALLCEGRFEPALNASERVELILERCQALVELKNSKTAVADPDKIKKSLTAEQRAGLDQLRLACRSVFAAEQRVAKAFQEQAWIKDIPLAACLKTRGAASPMELALRRRNVPALRNLREIGANIWLASAQAGQPKAAFWALSLRLNTENGSFQSGHWPDECALEVAKLLIQGAWLNGGDDPKAVCRQQILECAAPGLTRHNEPRWGDYVEQLASLCERVDLEEALAGLQRATAAPAPRARRAL